MNLPDARGWLVIAIVGLTFYIVTLIAINPKLAEVQLFGAIAMAVVSGGLGGAIGFYLGAAKSGAEKDAVIAKQLDKQP